MPPMPIIIIDRYHFGSTADGYAFGKNESLDFGNSLKFYICRGHAVPRRFCEKLFRPLTQRGFARLRANAYELFLFSSLVFLKRLRSRNIMYVCMYMKKKSFDTRRDTLKICVFRNGNESYFILFRRLRLFTQDVHITFSSRRKR